MTKPRPDPASEVPEFPVTRPDSRTFDPDETYARLRAHSPVSPVRCPAGMDAWLVSRYEDIRSVLTDPRLSSRGAGSMHMLPSYDGRDPSPGSMIQLDGEEHARLRRLLIGEFTMRRMEALRPSVQRITDRHIDAMLAGSSADLVRDFALPIPSLVICELLGVPYDDHGAFQRDSEVLIGFDADEATRDAATRRLEGYLGELITRRLAEPQDDLLSRLIVRGKATDRPLTVPELATLGVLLLVAGHESTANMIALSALVLMADQERTAALRAAPDTIGTSVEELLRYLSVIQFGLLRYATEDVTVGATAVAAGSWLVAAIPSGNRDEAVFTAPDTIDLRRPPRTHLAFGFGPHQCIGQQLARIELQVALTTLLRRVPGLRLAEPLAESAFKHNDIVFGLRSLPVVW
ncbi:MULTISPECIES: cytochrome P450 [unclassified Streptomyces]|uniref:cytochrome P450 n=1 Tax=unclassified Streptomyces TaxID=2593676 RepID=UPI00081B2A33|nr:MULTISPECIES: cytochrome P450 [unclassified Streptomyces]MYQ86700.1 cytochrome P450 [Streptomyces sp. SID4936]SCE30596.1 Cytochrome P450 [Streptomyces sp. DvalAA-43]